MALQAMTYDVQSRNEFGECFKVKLLPMKAKSEEGPGFRAR